VPDPKAGEAAEASMFFELLDRSAESDPSHPLHRVELAATKVGKRVPPR
jgi:hypothetical protein